MRSLVVLIPVVVIFVAVAAFGAEPICVDARRLQCDPNLSKCLTGAGSEQRTALCMERFQQCSESKRMPKEQCDRVVEDLKKASQLNVPRGRPW